MTISVQKTLWSHPGQNNREDLSSETLFLQWLTPVCHFPNVKPTSDYWKQTQMTQWLLWVITRIWGYKWLFVLWIIKFLTGILLFSHQLLVCFVPWPLKGQRIHRLHLLQKIQTLSFCFVELQYTSMCHFRSLFRAGLGGRDSLDWQAQMDSRSDLIVTRPQLNHCHP